MSIKYAYIHPYSREYLYAETREELQTKLTEFAAQVYVDHYCNGMAYTIVETLEDGSEKWYTPTGEQTITAMDIQAMLKQTQAFSAMGEIPTAILGG